MWYGLLAGFGNAVQPLNFLSIVLGSIIGFAIGAFPTLDATVATALIVPLTSAFSPVQALLLPTAIYCNGSYAGGISAILFRIPGSSETIMMTLDGYKFTEQSKANEALGLHLTSSVIGGILRLLFGRGRASG